MKELEPYSAEGVDNFGTQELMGLTSNIDQFDSNKIKKQINAVQSVIDKIELGKEFKASMQKYHINNEIKKPCKAKTRYSTRTDSMNSPNSVDLGPYWNKKKIKTEQIERIVEDRQKPVEEEIRNRSSVIKDIKNRMVKIKSSRNVLKVYNPFPTPMAEMF